MNHWSVQDFQKFGNFEKFFNSAYSKSVGPARDNTNRQNVRVIDLDSLWL